MIPAEAVEAAAKEIYRVAADLAYETDTWDDLGENQRQVWIDDAKRILEAAAQHMLAAAWQAGHSAGDGDQSAMWDARNSGKPVKYSDIVTPNPYRTTR